MTPIRSEFAPLVAYAVRDLNWLIVALMSVPNEVTVIPDGTPGFEGPDPPEVLGELLPQAAATRPAVATRVTLLIFDKRDPRPLKPVCKRIRPVPSEPDPPLSDATRSGSDERRAHLNPRNLVRWRRDCLNNR
jgi:hypothetical protein